MGKKTYFKASTFSGNYTVLQGLDNDTETPDRNLPPYSEIGHSMDLKLTEKCIKNKMKVK